MYARRRTSAVRSGVSGVMRLLRELALEREVCIGSRARREITRTLPSRLRLNRTTVMRWRSRFMAKRLDGLLDEPRPGAPRKISDAQVERVITRTLEAKPRDSTHWSTRSMARELGISQSAVSRIWRAFSLQPHRSETFKLSKDPLFIEKVVSPRPAPS